MIQIYRSEPLVNIDQRLIPLTPDEHRLLIELGMSDNRIVSHAVLLDVMCQHMVQIPADRNVLSVKLSRLRRKLGAQMLRNKRKLGYQLTGVVEFIG